MSFGVRLRFIRDQHGWTQEQLADVSGLTQPQISRLEGEINADPPISQVIHLAEALEVPFDVFLETDDVFMRAIREAARSSRPSAGVSSDADLKLALKHYKAMVPEILRKDLDEWATNKNILVVGPAKAGKTTILAGINYGLGLGSNNIIDASQSDATGDRPNPRMPAGFDNCTPANLVRLVSIGNQYFAAMQATTIEGALSDLKRVVEKEEQIFDVCKIIVELAADGYCVHKVAQLTRDAEGGVAAPLLYSDADNGLMKYSGLLSQPEAVKPQFLAGDKPTIISFAAPKGGVGKTTTALNFAAGMALKLKAEGLPGRVLVLDGDVANGNAVLRAGGVARPNMLDMLNHVTSNDVISHGGISSRAEMNKFVHQYPLVKKLDILPSAESMDLSEDLEDADLNTILVTLAKFYQYIVIDTGTQLLERANQAWLIFSQQIYLVVEPDVACLESTATYIERVRKMHIVKPDNFRIVMTRADMKAGIDPAQAVKATFPWIPDDKVFFIGDHSAEAYVAGNVGDLLINRSEEYRGDIMKIVDGGAR